MKKTKDNGSFFAYLPAMITALFSVATIILYFTVIPEQQISTLLGVIAIAFVPFLFIFVNRKCELEIPPILIYVMCVHCVLALDLGSAMGLYDLIPWWDIFLHGAFGFWGCAMIHHLYFRRKEENPKFLDTLVIVLLLLSLAALWEMYEFFIDFFLHTDMMDVEISLAKGKPAIFDTMTDMIIAVSGAILFETFLYAKKRIVQAKCRKEPFKDEMGNELNND